MIGDMIAKARKEKKMTKTELAKLTDINIGHLTHIEKGERNPSHKALKNICKALDIPYQQLMYTYDKDINEEQADYNAVSHISYNKLLAVDSVSGFVDCPSNSKDYGVFSLNGEILIRKFTSKKEKITLKADNKDFKDIAIKNSDDFYIIGKILSK